VLQRRLTLEVIKMLFKPLMLFDKDPDSWGGGEGAGNSDDKTAKT